MKILFIDGGTKAISIITLIFIAIIAWTIYQLVMIYNGKTTSLEQALRKTKYIKSLGLLALIVGILWQLCGFYHALSVISEAINISPEILYKGLKLSMISTIYGMIIYIISILLWIISNAIAENKLKKTSL